MSCSDHYIGRWWKFAFIILVPLLLLLPLLLIPEDVLPTQANHCLYVMLWMAIYWCTEVIPLPITALLPIFMFPVLGIVPAKEICNQYLTATVMMFVGGLMVALAVEKCNLHKRLAVGILHIVGTKPLWLMLGFMLPTAILSMWISNTATTAMMIPICEAVVTSMEESHEKKDCIQDCQSDATDILLEDETKLDYGTSMENIQMNERYITVPSHNSEDKPIIPKRKSDGSLDKPPISDDDSDANRTETNGDIETASNIQLREDETFKKQLNNFAKGMTLAVAYAANTGGTATLIGTPPNTILKGHADEIWQQHGYSESSITFASWMGVGIPVAFINLAFVWIWLTIFFNGFKSIMPCCSETTEDEEAVKLVIEKEYKGLGPISFAECVVAFLFLVMVVLWFFRSPSFMSGWADLDFMAAGYTHDVVVSIFIAFLLCILPAKLPRCTKDERGPVETLLDWPTIHKKMPWEIVFLIGGGFCLAKASTESGLSDWIADGLALMAGWPGWVMVLVISTITAFLTEVTSNSATCTIFLPIAASLAEGIGYNPLYLMIPVALSTSYAFMLPVATPPNAIAFSFGRLRILDMIKAGFLLNFICVGITTLAVNTWVFAFMDLGNIPWAVNSTAIPAT